ncbi:MAG: hypothetical protein ACTSYR_01705 [Candidatus Odinarchaeia archaeon]
MSNNIEILAKLKTFLEKEIEKLEDKLNELKEYLKAVNFYLIKGSIKRADEIKKETLEVKTTRTIKSKTGKIFGKITIAKNELVFTPNNDIKISLKTPSFKSFFIPKVLEKYANEDKLLIKNKKLHESLGFEYKIYDQNSIITKIVIKNYRTESRLMDIEKTLRWALEKSQT